MAIQSSSSTSRAGVHHEAQPANQDASDFDHGRPNALVSICRFIPIMHPGPARA